MSSGSIPTLLSCQATVSSGSRRRRTRNCSPNNSSTSPSHSEKSSGIMNHAIEKTKKSSASKNYKSIISRSFGRIIKKPNYQTEGPFVETFNEYFPNGQFLNDYLDFIQENFVGKVRTESSKNGFSDSAKLNTRNQIVQILKIKDSDKNIPNLVLFKRATRDLLKIFHEGEVFKRLLQDYTEMHSQPEIKAELLKNLCHIRRMFCEENPPFRLPNFDKPNEQEVAEFKKEASSALLEADPTHNSIENLEFNTEEIKFIRETDLSNGDSESTNLPCNSPQSGCENFSDTFETKENHHLDFEERKDMIDIDGTLKKMRSLHGVFGPSEFDLEDEPTEHGSEFKLEKVNFKANYFSVKNFNFENFEEICYLSKETNNKEDLANEFIKYSEEKYLGLKENIFGGDNFKYEFEKNAKYFKKWI